MLTVSSLSADRRPDPGGERAVLPGRDARRGGFAAQVPQTHVPAGQGRGQSSALVHGVRGPLAHGHVAGVTYNTNTVNITPTFNFTKTRY